MGQIRDCREPYAVLRTEKAPDDSHKKGCIQETFWQKALLEVQGKAAEVKVMEFLNAHREDEDPCECVILPDGSIEEPLPSHIGKLTELAGADPAVLHGHMEKSMEPLFWLAEYTGCMSVWQTRVVSPSEATQAQEDTLEELYDAALLAPGYLRENAGENYRESVKKAKKEIRPDA